MSLIFWFVKLACIIRACKTEPRLRKVTCALILGVASLTLLGATKGGIQEEENATFEIERAAGRFLIDVR